MPINDIIPIDKTFFLLGPFLPFGNCSVSKNAKNETCLSNSKSSLCIAAVLQNGWLTAGSKFFIDGTDRLEIDGYFFCLFENTFVNFIFRRENKRTQKPATIPLSCFKKI